MLRRFISKFNRTVSKRVVANRRKYGAPIKVSFEADNSNGRVKTARKALSIVGETTDLSSSGIGLIVPAIRLKEFYLVGENRVLSAEIDLPTGKIQMRIVGRRYEQIGEHISTSRYLIGARILDMADDHREAYETFIKYGDKVRKGAGSLKLGIDES